LVSPVRITGKVFENMDVLVLSIEKDGRVGMGEACGLYYKNDTPGRMAEQVESIRSAFEMGFSRKSIQACSRREVRRNALDCAVWTWKRS